MNKEKSVFSPNREISASSQHLFRKNNLIVSFGFILLCLIFGLSSATAQTRSDRTRTRQEERARRVNPVEQSDDDESDEVEDAKQKAPTPQAAQTQQNPLVRKTALTYTPRTGNQPAPPPALTNDIVIISRANVTAPSARTAFDPKAGAANPNMPSIWPVMGHLSSGFGVRGNPFGGSSTEFHKGQDIAVPLGTPVMATADGVVVSACWHHGYGNAIYIDHGNGIMTRYGHLSRIDVREGRTIKRGDLIALSGSTGRSTGPHLHYEVRINGEATNPLPYLPPVTPPTTPPAGAK